MANSSIQQALKTYWGYSDLRPLQAEAMEAGIDRRDSLVVMPTGGGKSLCYQVPAVVAQRTDVVISPLIALMKDQVDALRQGGYPAAALHSNLSDHERRETETGLAAGNFRLLFVAPERLASSWLLNLLQRMKVCDFAIDEAHCISHWGHDFRPEYRQLSTLRRQFEGACIHAFTATATPQVRQDIIEQLNLQDPLELVGDFDRANLVYRVLPRTDVRKQTLEAIGRHQNEAVIVYCLSRKDTEQMATWLKSQGVRAAHYHAGLDADERRATQDAFAREEIDVVAATVAFGMGIDRSNVRCVVHAAMPKSIEHYQQETGRAGRGGLEAECVLLYSAAAAIRWESLIQKSTESAQQPQEAARAQVKLLKQMQRFSNVPECRHKMLAEYFGQAYEKQDCGACDVCLGEVECIEDATVTAQKILSCVARVEQRFGVGYVVEVLAGAESQRVRGFGHDQLSTYGLLGELPKKTIQNYVYQLLDQGLVDRSDDERPTLRLNEMSWQVMRGEREVTLLRPVVKESKRKARQPESWEDVDRGLFEQLRQWRRTQSQQRGVPAYVILGDASLADLARVRPTSHERLLTVHGIGQKRASDFGDDLMTMIQRYCQENDVGTDVVA